MLVVYEEMLAKAQRGEKLTVADVAKGVLANALDPFGMYRAAGRAVMVFLSSSEVTNDDAENIGRILAKGRDAGLDEMEVEIDKVRFVGLKAAIPVDAGTVVTIEAGGSAHGKVRIKAKYK